MKKKRWLPISTLGLAVVVAVALTVGVPAMAPQSRASVPGPEQEGVADGVAAFYFHGNARCATCRKIEAYTDDAIRSGFAAQLAGGDLAWRVVNVEQPENRHFIQDFQLTNKSVVLAEYRDGKVMRFKNLDQVWQLVRSQDRFVAYVQGETREFLGASR